MTLERRSRRAVTVPESDRIVFVAAAVRRCRAPYHVVAALRLREFGHRSGSRVLEAVSTGEVVQWT